MAVNVYDELEALARRVSALEAAAKPKMALGVVSYFRPGAVWDETLAQKPRLTLINPGSGPGTAPSASYQAQVPKAQATGAKVGGYVYTDYGRRAAATVKADIDKHIAWYGVDAIFLDETANGAAEVAYYADLSVYIRAKGKLVILNPGTKTLEAYAPLADYIMVCETDAATYRTLVRPAWEAAYPGKFWHCVHTCAAAEMPTVVDTARKAGAGLVYVTEDVMPNPYDRLPTYYAALAAKVG